MAKQQARLEDWRFVPESISVSGKVYGHPRFDDGTQVTTSTVISPMDSIKEGGEIETRNTIYKLGNMYEGNQ